MKRLIAVAVLILAGCASPPYWVQEHAPLLHEQIHVVGASPWGRDVQGWITRDPTTGTCHIFITAMADRDCVLRHERRHCAGEGHPHYRRGFICQS